MNEVVAAEPGNKSYFDLCFLQYRVRLVFKNGKTAEGKMIHIDKDYYYLKECTYWISRRVPLLAVPKSKVEFVARLEIVS